MWTQYFVLTQETNGHNNVLETLIRFTHYILDICFCFTISIVKYAYQIFQPLFEVK
jgi:hypothetical protein